MVSCVLYGTPLEYVKSTSSITHSIGAGFPRERGGSPCRRVLMRDARFIPAPQEGRGQGLATGGVEYVHIRVPIGVRCD